jgi:TonB family protein
VGKGADVILGDANVKQPDPAAAGESAPVLFVAKPRARYTDAARSNSVQGNVTVRVTFNKNGSVGSIQVVLALPFGLTEQAIAAAKQIAFLPKRVNGVPVTATMTIQYSFSIY